MSMIGILHVESVVAEERRRVGTDYALACRCPGLPARPWAPTIESPASLLAFDTVDMENADHEHSRQSGATGVSSA
jgi:hypothetical protein